MAYITVLEGPMTVADSWRREGVRAQRRERVEGLLSVAADCVPFLDDEMAETVVSVVKTWNEVTAEANHGWALQELEKVAETLVWATGFEFEY